MNMRNADITKILTREKKMTGRSINFRIKTGKWHKFISDRRYGAFGEAYIKGWYIGKIGDLNDKEIKMLGYSSIEEYLAEPFNKGLTKESEKKFIEWTSFTPKWEVLNKINWRQKK